MNTTALICCLLILGHVATVVAVMLNMTKITKEFRQIVLEREETHRTLYAFGPDVETDSAPKENMMEYM